MIRVKELTHFKKMLLMPGPKLNLVLGDLKIGQDETFKSSINSLLFHQRDLFRRKPTTPHLNLLDFTFKCDDSLFDWKTFCYFILGKSINFPHDHDTPFALKMWRNYKKKINLNNYFEQCLQDPELLIQLLQERLNEITTSLPEWNLTKGYCLPVVSIERAERLKIFDSLSCRQSQKVLNMFLEWLNLISKPENRKGVNVVFNSEDCLFGDWLSNKVDCRHLQTHVVGNLDYNDAKIYYEQLLAKIEFENSINLKFDDIYEIVGGDEQVMIRLLDDLRIHQIPIADNFLIQQVKLDLQDFLKMKSNEKFTLKNPSHGSYSSRMKWDRKMAITICKDVAKQGFAVSEIYVKIYGKEAVDSMIEYGIFRFRPQKAISEDILNVPSVGIIVPGSPLHLYCLKKFGNELLK